MSVLNEKEIEKLKQIHPRKRILRFIFLVIGSLIITIGVWLFFGGVDYGILIEGINISFIIDILIVILGMILASKFFITPNYLRENSLTIKKLNDLREPVKSYVKFNSFAFTRLFAAAILIFVGILSLIVFGTDVGHEVQYGSAFNLGGPSFFYVTGLPALCFGFGLLLYFFISPFRGIFSQSESFYFFYEIRPLFPWLTEIPKKDVEAIRYQNTHLGPKLAWIMVLIPFIVLQLMTSIPLFAAERAAPEFVLSWTLTIISILEFVALILLVIFPQDYYEIATEDKLYEMWFAPFKFKQSRDLKKNIGELIECPNKPLESDQPLFSNINRTHFQLFDLAFGAFLIVSSIIILSNLILFGSFYWWIALIYGFMLIVKALCYDFSNKRGDSFYFDEVKKVFNFNRNFNFKYHHITAFKVEAVRVKKWFRKLDFFDVFGLSSLLIYLTIQQTEGWSIADTPRLVVDNLVGTIFMCIVFFFIFLYLCLPIDVIEFKTPSITYRIRITTELKEMKLKFLMKKYFSNLLSFPKDVFKDDLKKTFLLRVSFAGAIVIGSLIYALSILFTFFN